ncbi:MAG: histidine--tRNA ligase [Deltaproteobacteria bacterium]|nr:histidine--tRNA ligase [Deltaproteobacteria bacterium]
MKERVTPRRLKGFQDYGPDVMAKRLAILAAARKVAHRANFVEIATPALEYAEVLLGVGGETDKQVFRFLDGGERDVAMRYDLTVPFARYTAENFGTLIFPFKRLQIGDVWRAEKPQKGRFREFMQCDLDIIGTNAVAADLEIVACFYDILSQIVPSSFTIACNDRQILSTLIKKIFELREQSEEEQALIILDKLGKQGANSVLSLLREQLKVDETKGQKLLALMSTSDEGTRETAIAPYFESPEEKAIWKRFQETLQILRELCTLDKGKIVFDLSIARGLAYYTGLVFETTVDGVEGFGSICGGGRYDNLAGRFTQQILPGIGASLGVDRLAALLMEKEGAKESWEGEVFIAVATEDALSYAFQIAAELRRKGFVVETTLKQQKLSQQFKFANRKAFPVVLTVGEEEKHSRTVSLRDMRAGEEQKGINLESLVPQLQTILKR